MGRYGFYAGRTGGSVETYDNGKLSALDGQFGPMNAYQRDQPFAFNLLHAARATNHSKQFSKPFQDLQEVDEYF